MHSCIYIHYVFTPYFIFKLGFMFNSLRIGCWHIPGFGLLHFFCRAAVSDQIYPLPEPLSFEKISMTRCMKSVGTLALLLVRGFAVKNDFEQGSCDGVRFDGHWKVFKEGNDPVLIEVENHKLVTPSNKTVEICCTVNASYVIAPEGCAEGSGFLQLSACFKFNRLLYFYTLVPNMAKIPRSEVWVRPIPYPREPYKAEDDEAETDEDDEAETDDAETERLVEIKTHGVNDTAIEEDSVQFLQDLKGDPTEL